MCTYEDLVDATLPHGLIPLRRAAAAHDHPRRRGHRARHRVDQLPQRAAARVGARDGRLHRRRRGRHDPARRATCSTRSPTPTARSATPPGCGSSSSRCPAYVALRHVRFDDAGLLAKTDRRDRRRPGTYDGVRVDGLDGVAFAAGGVLPDAGHLEPRRTGGAAAQRLRRPADLLPLDPAARDRPADDVRLPVALGHRLVLVLGRVRRPAPAWSAGSGRAAGGARTSTTGCSASTAASASPTGSTGGPGRPLRERVIQDVEVPVERLREFLDWFDDAVGMRPVWLCPLVAPTAGAWPTYPLSRARPTSTSASGAPCTSAPTPRTARATAPSRRRSTSSAATSRSTPRRSTTARPSTGSTTARNLAAVKERYDPEDRLTSLYDKAVKQTMTHPDCPPRRSPSPRPSTSLLQRRLPVRFTAYDGSSAGPEDAPIGLDLAQPARAVLHRDRARRPRHGRAYVAGRPRRHGVHPGDPYEALHAARRTSLRSGGRRRRGARAGAQPRPLAPQAAAAAAAGAPAALAPHGRGRAALAERDAEVIHHHYDVSNRFYELVLGPSMTYTCAVYPTEDATLEEAQDAKYDLVARKLDLQPGQRLLDLGCGWGGMVRHAAREYGVHALGVTLSREQASLGAAGDQGGGARPPRRGAVPGLPARRGDRLRRDLLDRPDRAHRREQLPGVLRLHPRPAAPAGPAAQPLHHPATTTGRRTPARSSTATSSPTAS